MKNAIYMLTTSLFLLLNSASGLAENTAQSQDLKIPPTYITGFIDPGPNRDTIILEILKEFGSSGRMLPRDRTLVEVTQAGYFKFILPDIERPVYINLHTPDIRSLDNNDWRQHRLAQYLLMPGDSVHIHYQEAEKRIIFTGKSAPQFKWQYASRKLVTRETAKMPPASIQNNPELWLANKDSVLNMVLASLQAEKDKLPLDVYTILRADAIGMYLGNTYMNLAGLNFGAVYKDPVIAERTLNSYHKNLYMRAADTIYSPILAKSGFYATFLLDKARADYLYKKYRKVPQPASFFTALKNISLPVPLKEKMITAYLYQRIAANAITDTMMNDALAIIRDPRYKDAVINMQQTFGSGQLIDTGYRFIDRGGRQVSLADYKGKVILLDMWFTGCAGCIQVAKVLPEIEEKFSQNPDVVFVSLSIDKAQDKWKKSISGSTESRGKHFTTTSTKYLNTGSVGSGHPFIKKYNPTNTYPRLLVIDRSGRIYASNVPRPDAEGGQAKVVRLINNAANKLK